MVDEKVAKLTDLPSLWYHGLLMTYALQMKPTLREEFKKRGERIGLFHKNRSKPTACIHVRRGDKFDHNVSLAQPLVKYLVSTLH